MTEPDWQCEFLCWLSVIESEMWVHSAGSVLHLSPSWAVRWAGRRSSNQKDLVCLSVIPLLACAGTSMAPKNTHLIHWSLSGCQSQQQLEGWATVLCYVKCGPQAQESIVWKWFGMQMEALCMCRTQDEIHAFLQGWLNYFHHIGSNQQHDLVWRWHFFYWSCVCLWWQSELKSPKYHLETSFIILCVSKV